MPGHTLRAKPLNALLVAVAKPVQKSSEASWPKPDGFMMDQGLVVAEKKDILIEGQMHPALV